MDSNTHTFGQIEGFTLLEVMVVAGLSLAFAWLSLPELRKVLHDLHLKNDAQKMRGLILEAQSLARRYQSESVMKLDGGGIALTSKSAPLPIRQIRPEPATTVILIPEVITFYRSLANTPSRIVLVRGDRSCELILSLRGRVRERCS